MAITWTEDADSRVYLGPNVAQQDSVAAFAPSDYPTGGYSTQPAAFGMGRLRGIWEVGRASGPGLGVVWEFNKTNKTLQAYWTGSANAKMVEIPANTDLSGTTVQFTATGF